MYILTLSQSMPLSSLCSFAACFGILSHVLYYIRGSRVHQTLSIVAFHIISGIALLAWSVTNKGVTNGVVFSSAVSASYFAALFFSIAIYRVYFHPLRHFPGPLQAKISKLSNIFISKKLHEYQNKWARKYGGSIIRIAPNELLLVSIEGQQKVYGSQAKTTKHDTFYDFIHYKGAYNLSSIHNLEEHRWRRQVWDRALNSKAIARYTRYTQEVCHDWLEKLDELDGKPINILLYTKLIPFDNMGKMGYSVNFGTVKAGKHDHMLDFQEITFGNMGVVGQVNWLIKIAKDLRLSPEQREFEKLAIKIVDEREKDTTDDKEDIMKYLLADYNSEKPTAFTDRNALYADSQAIMFGGTDTIAASLAHCFYYLAKNPSIREKLREELGTVFGKEVPGDFTYNDVSRLDYLNAVIDETFRMNSVVCNNIGRRIPPEGITVDGQFIPGNVVVFVGNYTMHRSPKFFHQPDDFIPERWTSRPELVIDKRAYYPFLIGPYNCVGRRLALSVLHFALAYTVWYYDFEFAPGEDGVKFFSESRNNMVLTAGPCDFVFKKRA